MKKIVKTSLLSAIAMMIMHSCTKETAVIEDTQSDSIIVVPTVSADSVVATNTLKLDKFAMPPQVEGCSCYFSDTKENFEKEEYIYVDDYGNSAYIQMEGEMIKIPMEEGDFDPSNFSKTIENANYKVTMIGKKVNELDEVMMFAGAMTVENKQTGLKITSPIYGECGC